MRRRILSIIQTPTFGGPHNQMLRLTGPLAERGWDTLVVLPDEAGNGVERLQQASIDLVQIPIHRLRKKIDPRWHVRFVAGFQPTIEGIRKIIRDGDIDVVQVCGLMSLHGAIAAYKEGVPIVWQLLSTFAPKPMRWALTPFVNRMADVIMTTGVQVANEHPGLEKAWDRVVPFYPPVDTLLFKSDNKRRERARAELGVPDDAILVGTVGNQNWQKGHEFFVEVARELHKKHQHVYFRILGAHTPANADYYEREVIQKAERYGLFREGVFRIVEPGSRVAELLPAVDIFLLTSRAEGVPTSILEAMACGIPVVATNVGAVEEVVVHGKTGYTVTPIDVDALASYTSDLINDQHKRREMGQQSRQEAVARFDTSVCTEVHAEAYECAISHHMASTPREAVRREMTPTKA